MPCPYFEPQQATHQPQHASARLPLLDEYDGLCHATEEAAAVPGDVRFRCCNHGYSRGFCQRLPALENLSGLRYSILRRTDALLEVLCIEEQDYAPLRWHSIQYFFEGGRIEPEPLNLCIRAQVLAFCRSYLKRFVD